MQCKTYLPGAKVTDADRTEEKEDELIDSDNSGENLHPGDMDEQVNAIYGNGEALVYHYDPEEDDTKTDEETSAVITLNPPPVCNPDAEALSQKER